MRLSRRKAKGTPQADGGGGVQRSSCAQAQRPQGPDGAGPERGLQKGLLGRARCTEHAMHLSESLDKQQKAGV